MGSDRETFRGILKDVLGVDPARVADADSAASIKGWNSMTHMKLVARLEKAFGLRFGLGEIVEAKTVGDLKRLLARHAREVG